MSNNELKEYDCPLCGETALPFDESDEYAYQCLDPDCPLRAGFSMPTDALVVFSRPSAELGEIAREMRRDACWTNDLASDAAHQGITEIEALIKRVNNWINAFADDIESIAAPQPVSIIWVRPKFNDPDDTEFADIEARTKEPTNAEKHGWMKVEIDALVAPKPYPPENLEANGVPAPEKLCEHPARACVLDSEWVNCTLCGAHNIGRFPAAPETQQPSFTDSERDHYNRLLVALDATAEHIHPEYGPCDGLGPDGMCSECHRLSRTQQPGESVAEVVGEMEKVEPIRSSDQVNRNPDTIVVKYKIWRGWLNRLSRASVGPAEEGRAQTQQPGETLPTPHPVMCAHCHYQMPYIRANDRGYYVVPCDCRAQQPGEPVAEVHVCLEKPLTEWQKIAAFANQATAAQTGWHVYSIPVHGAQPKQECEECANLMRNLERIADGIAEVVRIDDKIVMLGLSPDLPKQDAQPKQDDGACGVGPAEVWVGLQLPPDVPVAVTVERVLPDGYYEIRGDNERVQPQLTAHDIQWRKCTVHGAQPKQEDDEEPTKEALEEYLMEATARAEAAEAEIDELRNKVKDDETRDKSGVRGVHGRDSGVSGDDGAVDCDEVTPALERAKEALGDIITIQPTRGLVEVLWCILEHLEGEHADRRITSELARRNANRIDAIESTVAELASPKPKGPLA